MLAGQDLKRITEEREARMKACQETGTWYGFSDLKFKQPARHLASGKRVMQVDGTDYYKCENCGALYYTPRVSDDWKYTERHDALEREQGKRPITI